jgi:hypothetical protein
MPKANIKIWVTKDAVYRGRIQAFSERPALQGNHYTGEGVIHLGWKSTPRFVERLAHSVASRKRGPWCLECDVQIRLSNDQEGVKHANAH